MAIRDVVTRGFGNGTYDPGVNKIPTRGYSVGAIAPLSISGSDYTLPPSIPNYSLDTNQPRYSLKTNQPRYTIPE